MRKRCLEVTGYWAPVLIALARPLYPVAGLVQMTCRPIPARSPSAHSSRLKSVACRLGDGSTKALGPTVYLVSDVPNPGWPRLRAVRLHAIFLTYH